MIYTLEIRPLATIEIIEAYDWYELKSIGLGNKFLLDLDNFFFILVTSPQIHSYYQKPVRQGRLSNFPYLIVYEIFAQMVVVYSVFMARKDPGSKRTF